jgi:hypothetical protein
MNRFADGNNTDYVIAPNMDLGSWLVIALLGGAFLFGIWYMLIRDDDRSNLRRTIDSDRIRSRNRADFSKARDEFERKLAEVNRHLDSKRAAEREVMESEEELRRKSEEEAARIAAEEEATLKAELEAEEARKAAEYEAQRAIELEEARRLADEREAERQAEEARLAEERESKRQEELAGAEAERLLEIEALKAAEELAAKEASNAALSELRERLEREGAKSSDVQISLIWNNFNDLDLHVVCPSGERIHGGNRHSKCDGELDVDANVRPETKKPVENVVWPEGVAPGGTYRAYVHHYKKHKKRRAKDPTKFKVIVNSGGEVNEYKGALSYGDPIMLIAEFTVEAPEVRAAKAAEAKARLAAIESGEIDAEEMLKQLDGGKDAEPEEGADSEVTEEEIDDDDDELLDLAGAAVQETEESDDPLAAFMDDDEDEDD